jgi:hypothetical protein
MISSEELAKLVVGLSSQLLGVIVTIIALVPTLSILAKQGTQDLMQRKQFDKFIQRVLASLATCLILSSGGCLLACCSLFIKLEILVVASAVVTLICVFALGCIGAYIAYATSKSL